MDANKFRMAPKDTMAKWEWTCGGGQWRRLLSKIWGWVGAETLVSGEGSIRKARNNQAKVPLCVWEKGGVEHEPNCAEGLLAPGRGREAAPDKDRPVGTGRPLLAGGGGVSQDSLLCAHPSWEPGLQSLANPPTLR